MPNLKKKLPEKEASEQEILQAVKAIEEKGIVKEDKNSFNMDSWSPKSSMGKKVKSGAITNIDEILDRGEKILEYQIVDALVPNLNVELLLVGQSKGKFGGGSRRIFRQTQKKTKEGNKPKFATIAVVGNGDGYVGVGYGKSKETVPSREKAIRNAKLNLIKIKRGCGSWQCGCKGPHTIPYKVEGKCSSVIIKLMPAPKGTGLVMEKECAKMLTLAGIKDVWSKTYGKEGTKMNLITACFTALKKLMEVKTNSEHIEKLGIVDGSIRNK